MRWFFTRIVARSGLTGCQNIRSHAQKYKEFVLANYKEPDLNGHFDVCTKHVLKKLYVQKGEMSDSNEESAEPR